jgi:Ca2+-binding RTX toxin-like protein
LLLFVEVIVAQITVGNNSQFDIRDINFADIRDLDIISISPTLRELGLNADDTVELAGTGFTYDGSQNFTGGTLTGISAIENNQLSFAISGFSIAATTFRDFVFSGDSATLFAQLFDGADDMTGGGDSDYLNGYGGHDNIFGGAGSDTLIGDTGNDHLYGRSASGGTDGTDSLSGGDGSDYLQGNAGGDTLDGGAGSDRILGGAGDDQASGSAGNDSLNGNLGNDTLRGDADNDLVRGGQGSDSLSGGDGADQLFGDLGSDTLNGGAGIDYFHFSGNGSLLATPDRVTDFTDGSDRLFIGFTVSTVLTGDDQASASAAATAAQVLFDGNAGNGEVAAIQVGADTYLFYAGNGGATVDSAVVLAGITVSQIGTTDFL